MRTLTVVLVIGLMASLASASVVYSNFGADMTYRTSAWLDVTGGGNVATYKAWAAAFVPAADYTLDSVQVAIAAKWPGTFIDSAALALCSDSAGRPGPGGVLEDLGLVQNDTMTASIITASSASHPVLKAGKKYWIAMTPSAWNSWVLWYMNSKDYDSAGNAGGGWTSMSFPEGAMLVQGTPTPEPATLSLLALGSLLIARRRA